jgi:hypothetical protein
MVNTEKLNQAERGLELIQNFDPTSLGRSADLGKYLNFEEIVPDALELIDTYKQIPLSVLRKLTPTLLDAIIGQAQIDTKLFEQITTFESTAPNASAARDQLISTIKQRRDTLFQSVFNIVSYANTQYTDIKKIKKDADEAIKTIKKSTDEVIGQLEKNKTESDKVLSAIRQTAGEQGVSQQAFYFKSEAANEEIQAGAWLSKIYWLTGIISTYVIANLLMHKCSWLAPSSNYEAVQFISSKLLIFGFLAYLLILSARNYASHKHNAVVNRHRENALLTYKTLVEAGNEESTQDIVLAYAAACIFSPQETGFTNNKNELSGSKSILELITKSPKASE